MILLLCPDRVRRLVRESELGLQHLDLSTSHIIEMLLGA